MSYKVDQDLEKNPLTCVKKCLQDFLQKGGVFQSVSNLASVTEPIVRLDFGDAVYPVCSGGWCRSQSLWALLTPFSNKITLFPPHAARHGWDPYNGQINRYRNYAQELLFDEFSSNFGMEKSLRFGFENSSKWKSIEESPTEDGLKRISTFYDQFYFGPDRSWEEKAGKNRIYITFSNNAHVVLYRLIQTNEHLEGVTVVSIDCEDLVTDPPDFLNTTKRSVKAYGYFASLLNRIFDLDDIINESLFPLPHPPHS